MPPRHNRNARLSSKPQRPPPSPSPSPSSSPFQPLTPLPDAQSQSQLGTLTPESDIDTNSLRDSTGRLDMIDEFADFDGRVAGADLAPEVGADEVRQPGFRSPPVVPSLLDESIMEPARQRPPSLRLWDQPNDDAPGHTRSPVLSREPTMLESFSRTVRNYVPSSIPIPTAAPSPPLVSRPVSFGSFMSTPSRREDTMRNRVSERRGRDEDGFFVGEEGGGRQPRPGFGQAGSGLAQAMQRGAAEGTTSYPRASSVDRRDPILWARWDTLGSSRFLLLAYPSGLQIWDCTSLGSVSEVLNLNLTAPDWGGQLVHAAVLPRPRSAHANDALDDERPLLGILTISDSTRDDADSTFSVYSLSRHHIVQRSTIPGVSAAFTANELFVVISTTAPPTLHILSASTFAIIFTVHSLSLIPFTHKSSTTLDSALNISNTNTNSNNNNSNNNNINNNVSVYHTHVDPSPPPTPPPTHPQPIFALSHRLLAYASPRPRHDSPTPPAARHPRTRARARTRSPSYSSSSPGSPFGGMGLGMTQAELGSAALKVGGSVLSGMKALGGMAYSAARSRALGAVDGGGGGSGGFGLGLGLGPGAGAGAGGAGFFSRSAPAGAVPNAGGGRGEEDGRGRGRRYSSTSSTSEHLSVVAPHTPPSPEHGFYVTIVDLAPLHLNPNPHANANAGQGAQPRVVAEFLASRSQQIVGLRFSDDGTEIVVAPRDGQVVRVYQVRPAPLGSLLLGGGPAEQGPGERGGGGSPAAAKTKTKTKTKTRRDSRGVPAASHDAPWHSYDLRRGRTSAVVEGLAWAGDGRWVAVGTRKRTVHVFPVNPYGGPPDHRSHMDGQVKNSTELQPLSTEVTPLVRLRAATYPAPGQWKAPLAFTFIRSSERSLPATLLPPTTSAPPTGPAPPSEAAPQPQPQSPHPHPHPHLCRPKNYQDVLVFDPTDGMLSLRRLTLELRARDQGLSSASAAVLGATSISLPGMGGAGRLSSSPSSGAGGGGGAGAGGGGGERVSGLTQMMDVHRELVGKESIVATWNLQRRSDWSEIRSALEEPGRGVERDPRGRVDWLAQAELSTCSRSPRVLPRSLYLSHQFSFHTLGEDYHALIRRYQLDVGGGGFKIDVRREVQASAYATGKGGESFMDGGFTAPRDIRSRHPHPHPHHRPAASSFDEPLATALAAGLDYSPPPAVLPMLPNGAYPRASFRGSIPARAVAGLGDGVSEGFGRIRREIRGVRSPLLVPRADGGGSAGPPVPLEFDEEDEDFMGRGGDGGSAGGVGGAAGGAAGRDDEDSRSGGRTGSATSVSTPATDVRPLDLDDAEMGGEGGDDDVWNGWAQEDKEAVEEAERFDHISVVGFLDEEMEASIRAGRGRHGRRGV